MDIALLVLEWIVGAVTIGWFVWWRLQKDESGPWGFLLKAAATAAIGFIFVRYGVAYFREGGLTAVVGLGAGMFCGLALGIIWQNELTGVVGNLFGGIYDDKTELEPKPYYSSAEAKRMAGNITGAIADVRAELGKFPDDYDGRMRLAALLAEHSEDLPGALAVLEDALQLKELSPGQIAYVLNTAADWQLKFARDADAARLALERITTLAPGSEAALHAQQRLANLATPEMLAREDNRQPIKIPEFDRKPGQRRKFVVPEKLDINAEERRLRDRLTKNANDWTAREEIARLYAEQFEFYDRALQELEFLISTPGQPQREVVKWLHQKADWQVKYFDDVTAGRLTLKRIQEMYPKSAVAHRAGMAMMHLQSSSKVKKKPAEE